MAGMPEASLLFFSNYSVLHYELNASQLLELVQGAEPGPCAYEAHILSIRESEGSKVLSIVESVRS